MARVIFENDKGEMSVIMTNVPDYIFPEAVIVNKASYFATKMWSREDIKDEIEQMGYEPSEELVDRVVKEGGRWRQLKDCYDFEFEAIREVIRKVV